MKRCEDVFSLDYQEKLEKLNKNTVKFAKKFKLDIRDADTPENRYKLLRNDFERVYPNLDFEEEWKKFVEEN